MKTFLSAFILILFSSTTFAQSPASSQHLMCVGPEATVIVDVKLDTAADGSITTTARYADIQLNSISVDQPKILQGSVQNQNSVIKAQLIFPADNFYSAQWTIEAVGPNGSGNSEQVSLICVAL